MLRKALLPHYHTFILPSIVGIFIYNYIHTVYRHRAQRTYLTLAADVRSQLCSVAQPRWFHLIVEINVV